jgi:hypothetical protein
MNEKEGKEAVENDEKKRKEENEHPKPAHSEEIP